MSATPTPEAATAGSRFPPTRANREPSGSGAGTRGEGPLEEFEYPSPLAVLIGGGAAAALVSEAGGPSDVVRSSVRLRAPRQSARARGGVKRWLQEPFQGR